MAGNATKNGPPRAPVLLLLGAAGAGKTALLGTLLHCRALDGVPILLPDSVGGRMDRSLLLAGARGEAAMRCGVDCFTDPVAALAADPGRGGVLELDEAADLLPLLRALAPGGALARTHALAGIVALLDAMAADNFLTEAALRRQAGLADRLLLTRGADAGPGAVAALMMALKLINPAVPAETETPDAAAARSYLAAEADAAAKAAKLAQWLAQEAAQAPANDGVPDPPRAVSLELRADEPLDGLMLEEWLADARHRHGLGLRRVKGYAWLEGEAMPVGYQASPAWMERPVRLEVWPERPARSRFAVVALPAVAAEIAESFLAFAGPLAAAGPMR